MYSVGPSAQPIIRKAYWITPEQELYNEIYWELWEEGWRDSDLRKKVAATYRGRYGN